MRIHLIALNGKADFEIELSKSSTLGKGKRATKRIWLIDWLINNDPFQRIFSSWYFEKVAFLHARALAWCNLTSRRKLSKHLELKTTYTIPHKNKKFSTKTHTYTWLKNRPHQKPRRILAHLRSNKSPFIISYLKKISPSFHPSPSCPLCHTHLWETPIIFSFAPKKLLHWDPRACWPTLWERLSS